MINTIFKSMVLGAKIRLVIWRCNVLLRKRDRLNKRGHQYHALDINNQANMLVKKGESYSKELKDVMAALHKPKVEES